MINPNTKVVPIDHGWANMKTEQYIIHGKTEDTKASLISEAVNVLSNMSELQIQQCLAMMKALKNVQITD